MTFPPLTTGSSRHNEGVWLRQSPGRGQRPPSPGGGPPSQSYRGRRPSGGPCGTPCLPLTGHTSPSPLLTSGVEDTRLAPRCVTYDICLYRAQLNYPQLQQPERFLNSLTYSWLENNYNRPLWLLSTTYTVLDRPSHNNVRNTEYKKRLSPPYTCSARGIRCKVADCNTSSFSLA